MKHFLLFLFSILTLSGAAQLDHCIADRYAQTALFDSTDIVIDHDVHYATAERWPSTIVDSLHLDVYRPDPLVDDLALRPLIVMVHGGAWLQGDRNELAYHSMEMARRGFVAATITYRLGWDCPTNNVLAMCAECSGQSDNIRNALYRAVQDERAALRYLVANAEEYGIDSDNIFVQGESAGSFTVLNSTFWDQSEADEFCPWCLDDMGPLDSSGNSLTETYEIKGVVNNCGGITSLDYMDGQDIPVIGFHDEWDCVAPYGGAHVLNCLGCTSFFYTYGSDAIRGRLNQNGTCYRMNRTLASVGHCTYPSDALIRKSACFLKSILCQECSSDITAQIWDVPDCTAGGLPDGIYEHPSFDFSMYPDPATEQVTLSIPAGLSPTVRIEILTADGREEAVYDKVKSASEFMIDLQRIGAGLKLIRITDDRGRTTAKRLLVE